MNGRLQGGSVFRVLVRFLLVCVAVAAALRLWYGPPQGSRQPPPAAQRPVTARGELAPSEASTIELFERASPSVVHITTSTVRRDFFSLNVLEIPQGTGSGFVWDLEGHIVTNFHVLQNAQVARVTLADNTTWEARLVGAEPDKDIAVLRIDAPAERLRALPVGTSSDLKVGQSVFAIGNPFGLDQTLTSGIISGLGREIRALTGRPIRDVIQTDAAINPGNSGGPLLDSAGRLIGVNTSIISPSNASAGIGFAVPVDTVNRIVPQIVRYGRPPRAGFGITVAGDHVLRRFGQKGVLVMAVLPGTKAEKVGLRPTRQDASGRVVLGDIIVDVGGHKIAGTNDLLDALEERKAGETVTVQVLRQGENIDLAIELQALAEE